MPAGAKPGERRGGRQKGTPNKATVAKQQSIKMAEKLALAGVDPDLIDGLSPLDVMLLAMRASAKAGHLLTAANVASQAAPYILPRLAAATVTHRDLFSDMKYEQLLKLMRLLDNPETVINGNPNMIEEIVSTVSVSGDD